MKDQFVTHEIALKLNELGFDEGCICLYGSEDIYSDFTGGHLEDKSFTKNSELPDPSDHWVAAPLWQQAIDWFREEHDTIINIHIGRDRNVSSIYDNKNYQPELNINGDNQVLKMTFYTYAEAREFVVLTAIELKS